MPTHHRCRRRHQPMGRLIRRPVPHKRAERLLDLKHRQLRRRGPLHHQERKPQRRADGNSARQACGADDGRRYPVQRKPRRLRTRFLRLRTKRLLATQQAMAATVAKPRPHLRTGKHHLAKLRQRWQGDLYEHLRRQGRHRTRRTCDPGPVVQLPALQDTRRNRPDNDGRC